MSEIIQSVLISGELDNSRLARALGELAEFGTIPAEVCKPVLVIDSDGGDSSALHGFIECILEDQRTRAAAEGSDVKIYNAQSAAAVIALSLGCRREMAAGTLIGLHLPLVALNIGDVEDDDRITPRILEGCRKTEQVLERLINRHGLGERKSGFYSSGWLRVTAEDCLSKGLVNALFHMGPRECVFQGAESTERRSDSGGIRTVLISGLLTQELLGRVQWELRELSVRSPDQDVVLIINSPGGALFPILAFLNTVMQEEGLHRVVERASVKIYEAHSAAALLAFSLGCRHELARDAKVGFHLGKIWVQVGDPSQLDSIGRVSSEIMEGWRQYQLMVSRLMERLGLDRDPKLQAEFWASGRVELTAADCLRRGIVSRLF